MKVGSGRVLRLEIHEKFVFRFRGFGNRVIESAPDWLCLSIVMEECSQWLQILHVIEGSRDIAGCTVKRQKSCLILEDTDDRRISSVLVREQFIAVLNDLTAGFLVACSVLFVGVGVVSKAGEACGRVRSSSVGKGRDAGGEAFRHRAGVELEST